MATKEIIAKTQEDNPQIIRSLEQELKQLSLRKKSHKTREPKQKKKHRSTTQELIVPINKPNLDFKRKQNIKKFQKVDWKYGKIEKKTHQFNEECKEQTDNKAQALSDSGYERVIEQSLKNSKESLNESFGNEDTKPRGFSFNEIRDDLLKMQKNEKEEK